MGLFLRKSFKAGPVRINLSKSGIGVSGGVKGARVGVNSKGKMYVAGGKGAIRYRKTIGNKKSTTKKSTQDMSNYTNTPIARQDNLKDEIFIDTKVTYPNKINKSKLSVGKIPEPPQEITHIKLFYIIGIITLLFSSASGAWLTLSITSFVIAIIRSRMNKNLKKQIEQAQENQDNLLNALENEESFERYIYSNMDTNINKQLKKIYDFVILHTLFLGVFEKPEFITNEKLTKVKKLIDTDERIYNAAKLKAFKDVFNLYIEDLKIDKDEEQSLLNAIDIIKIDKDIISDELNTIKKLSDVREKINEELSPINADINLKKEKCFYKTEAKIVKEKVLKRRTINGRKIKKVGYTIEREGTAYLTDKRILLVGSGTYSTKIDKILDIIITPENNTIELSVDGRKTPIIYTTPNATVFGAKIQKVIDAING